MHAPPRPGAPAVIFVGVPVDPLPTGTGALLADDPLVVAADSGLDLAVALGATPHLVVGDLDSASASGLAWAEARGVAVERHPVDKDETDLELALGAAARWGARRVTVVGGQAGRLDHLLATAEVLAAPRFAGLVVDAHLGPAWLTVVRGRASLHGDPGEVVSLLPVGGPARGVRTRGLKWPLEGDDLPPGTTRGVSNVLTDTWAEVEVADGALLAVLPGAAPAPELRRRRG